MQGFGMWNSKGEGTPVSLTAVRFKTRVTALGQKTCVEQVFINRESQPIEAIYTFPLPDGAAVCGFEAITGERVLTGEIEELSKGIEKYEAAIEEGHGAFMAELWRPDVFSTRIGNLKPNQAVLIRLTYLAEIDIAERKLRFALPTTLAPRYGTSSGMDRIDAAIESDALNPPHVLAIPYGLELSIEIDLGLKLKSVGSPSHGLRIEPPADSSTLWKASLAAARADMNQSVIIEAELARELSATAFVEEGVDPSEEFISVNFLPEFDAAPLDEVPSREVIFVLDCSGSMDGSSIEQARRALALCLKSLNEGDRFNICRFGSTFNLMHPESVLYSQTSLDRALAFLSHTSANLGGTELLAPLNAVLQRAHPEHLREIILLTDGQVTNEPALVKLAGAFRGKARIFSFGIGPASSEFLVRGIASATGGASEFIAPEERIEAKVLRMFGRMASPRLDHIEVDWHHAEADAEPRQLVALFDGEPLRIAARLAVNAPAQVTLRALWNGQQQQWTVPVTLSPFPREAKHGPIALSWARRRLAALELAGSGAAPSDQARSTIVALSKRFGILSQETTLLAIEHRSLEDRTRGVPAQRRIPVMLAKDWGGDRLFDAAKVMFSKGGAVQFAVRRDASPAAPAPGSAGGVSLSKRKRSDSSGTSAAPPDQVIANCIPDTDSSSTGNSETDALNQLLMRQSAEGSFAWDESLNQKPFAAATEERVELDGLVASLPPAVRDKALATALTIAAFHRCFPSQKDLWELAAKKATRWLAKASPAIKEWIDRITLGPKTTVS